MAQIILIYPVTGLDMRGVSVWLPLSVLSVASTLVDRFDVQIIDQRVDGDWEATLRRSIGGETVCVGISSMTGTQIHFGLLAAKIVREENPDLPIVWGGNHPTLLPEQTAQHRLVDIVVVGEGEETFSQLADCLSRGAPWKSLSNIAYKSGEKIQVNLNEKPAFLAPDANPELPYHLVDVEKYVHGRMTFGRPVRSLPFITSNGCPYECTFCCQPVLSKRRWRKMSPEVAYERSLKLMERFQLDAIEFHDEEFFVNRKRGEEIGGLIKGQFDWYVQTRMDDLLELDLHRLEKNGLKAVQPGLETGSERILDLIKKRETIEHYRQANKRLSRTGISATYNFMMGFPDETYQDVLATVDLAIEMLDANPKAHVSGFYVYVPYPGAELFDQAVEQGFQAPCDLEGWTKFNRQHLDTPWVKENRALFENLLISSKFIDGDRLKKTFSNNLFLPPLVEFFSQRYQKLWRAHSFKKSWDIQLFALAGRYYFAW